MLPLNTWVDHRWEGTVGVYRWAHLLQRGGVYTRKQLLQNKTFLEKCFQLTMTEEDFYFYPDSCVNLSQNGNGHQFRLL